MTARRNSSAGIARGRASLARLTTRRWGSLRAFWADESGVLTVLGLFIFLITLMISGYAVDYWNAVRARTHLQVNSDATAHAALVSREFGTADTAIADAMNVAYANMPKAQYGDIVDASDITFGDWNATTRTFTADPNSRTAVEVRMHRTSARGNPVGTFLYKLVGINSWNISTKSIFDTYYRSCTSEGFVAENTIDLQSNNVYKKGFCIHSNNAISINSNNSFETGVQVTMPDPATIQLPSSGFSSNPGLQDALRSDSWDIRILSQIDTIMAGLSAGNSDVVPSYITNLAPIAYNQGKIGNGDLVSGNIYTASCNGNSPLNISSGTVLSKVVLVTNCNINFGSSVQLHDVVIASTNTSNKAVTGASGLEVGLNDNCAPGGGAQIITDGGMDFPSAMSLFGGQLIAKQDVTFSASGNGVQGASVISGATLSGTSNMTMAYCGSGMEENFQAEYFRMVQ
ncbi:TadE/TadG family type IV pilus assembly protein [Solirhodobacter olei]|uniref:TadE/TadG family type IV pilus assembly protein n=1 Tax=Solirhodobacter olei TaxID=2493082 RepID=UPI0013E2A28F|nr:TadG family pilus assembly protein [Solirhodobacter olei]